MFEGPTARKLKMNGIERIRKDWWFKLEDAVILTENHRESTDRILEIKGV